MITLLLCCKKLEIVGQLLESTTVLIIVILKSHVCNNPSEAFLDSVHRSHI